MTKRKLQISYFSGKCTNLNLLAEQFALVEIIDGVEGIVPVLEGDKGVALARVVRVGHAAKLLELGLR